MVSSSPAHGAPGERKLLHRQGLGPKLTGGWGAAQPAAKTVRQQAAEIKPTEPGRASPAKGVRHYPDDYRFVVSSKNHRHRRWRDGARDCVAPCAVWLSGDCL